uniref:Uncharacterized protein n=1 Tax=Anopheles atroparvus TaxID=41427 RepID=A0A182JKJ6_ANOAO
MPRTALLSHPWGGYQLPGRLPSPLAFPPVLVSCLACVERSLNAAAIAMMMQIITVKMPMNMPIDTIGVSSKSACVPARGQRVVSTGRVRNRTTLTRPFGASLTTAISLSLVTMAFMAGRFAAELAGAAKDSVRWITTERGGRVWFQTCTYLEHTEPCCCKWSRVRLQQDRLATASHVRGVDDDFQQQPRIEPVHGEDRYFGGHVGKQGIHRIALAVALDVRCNAGVVAGLMSRHHLQRQCGTAHDDARLGVVLYDLILQRKQMITRLLLYRGREEKSKVKKNKCVGIPGGQLRANENSIE